MTTKPNKHQREHMAITRSALACSYSSGKDYCISLNNGDDVITLERSFLRHYAFSNAREGDALSQKWGARGWQPLGHRVTWRVTPYALEFSTSRGNKFQIRREALRDWLACSKSFYLEQTK